MKILTKVSALILVLFCFAGNFYAEAAEATADIDTQEVETYMATLGELQGEKVRLCDNDDPESQLILAEYALDDDVCKFVFFLGEYHTAGELLQFLGIDENGEKISKDPCPGYKPFIIKNLETNQPMGKCWLDCSSEDIDISYWIGKQFRGNGYVADAVKTILERFYEDKITMPLSISIRSINDKSLGALKKIVRSLGFENFTINKDFEGIFESPKYKLEQKAYILSEKFDIDPENPDLVVVSVYISGQKVDEFKKIKKLFNSEYIEKGHLEIEYLKFLFIPIYES